MRDLAGFSHRLEVAIAKSGKRKGEVARAVGLTPNSLSRYLKGNRLPHQTVLTALAQILGVSVEFLTGEHLDVTAEISHSIADETQDRYTPDAVALTGLDAEDRHTVLRLLEALRSGETDIRRHLIGQLKIIEQALHSRRRQPREERRNVS